MKNHWRAIHFDAWQAARQDALSSAQSLRSTFTRPCQYCGSMAKHGNNNATHHATKCSPLFQVLAARKLQREGSLEMHMQACRGPALKQREKPKQYDQLENHDVAAQLRARGQTFSTTASGETKQDKAKVATTHQLKADGASVVQANTPTTSTAAAAPAPNLPDFRARELIFANPHNLCYMNASLTALLHTVCHEDLPRGLRQLRALCHRSSGRPLNLSNQLIVASLLRGWRLDAQQKDAAEFLQFLLERVGLPVPSWEARTFVRGVSEVAYGGGTMLSLALPSEDCDLQELVSRWHEQTELHALLEEVRYVPLLLGRYPARGKLFVQVRFRQHVHLPVFVDQMNVRWVRYYCVAGLVHDGELPTSGHYRALLRDEDSPETWYVTDDHRVAVPCNVANYHHSNIYVLWLKKL